MAVEHTTLPVAAVQFHPEVRREGRSRGREGRGGGERATGARGDGRGGDGRGGDGRGGDGRGGATTRELSGEGGGGARPTRTRNSTRTSWSLPREGGGRACFVVPTTLRCQRPLCPAGRRLPRAAAAAARGSRFAVGPLRDRRQQRPRRPQPRAAIRRRRVTHHRGDEGHLLFLLRPTAPRAADLVPSA